MRFTDLRSAVPILVTCVLVAACGSSRSTPPSESSTDSSTASSAAPTSITVTTTPARDRLDWILDLINGPPPDQATVEAGFSPEFLAEVPYDQILAAAGVFAGGADWAVATDSLEPHGGEATVRSSSGSEVTVSLAVDESEPHRITGLRFVPVLPDPFPPDATVTAEAIAQRLAELGPAAFGLFEVTDGSCREIAGDGTDRAVPLGSAFKLWVLGALALEVEAGRAAWDEPFAVVDELKSSEDGEISSLADGTPVTLRALAELMISISDNSATDHLLARLGREQVETAMAASGIADPAPNIPMLSTREVFLLKWSDTIDTDGYLALDAAGRRAVLDEQLAGVHLADAIDAGFRPTEPTRIDTIEWFATPSDMCRTQVWLADLAERPGLEPVAAILQLNPGVPFDPRWTDVRFKGGSEPGLVFGTWRISDAKGRAFVIAGGVANPDELIDEVAAAVTLAAASRLIELG